MQACILRRPQSQEAGRLMPPAATISIDESLCDQNLLGAGFGDLSTWSTWIVGLKAAFGEPLTADERAIFAQIAGERAPPDRRVRELWAVVSRRAGKSRVAAAVGTYLGAIVDHRH